MQRLELRPGEKITRKEYLKRKKKQAKSIRKKRSKITYIIIVFLALLSIYICAQFYVYSKTNNFKYVDNEDVKAQQVYNVYYVTEGYTYDPVYSLNSIRSDGFSDDRIFENSGLHEISLDENYIYGLKLGGLFRLKKNDSSNTLDQLVEKDVNKYLVKNNRAYIICGTDNRLRYVNLETKEIVETPLTGVVELIVDDSNIYAAVDEKTKKTLYKADLEGNNKTSISGDSNVSYIMENGDTIYFINKQDSNKIYSVKKDGTSLQKIGDITGVSDKGNIKEIDGSKYMFVSDNYLYYVNVNEQNTLWRINLDDKTNEKVLSMPIEILQFVGKTIFYKIKGEMGVCLYNLDTRFMSQTTNRKLKEFVVDENAAPKEIVGNDKSAGHT